MLSSLESIFISIMYQYTLLVALSHWKIYFLNFYLHEIITSGDEVDFALNWGLFVGFTTKITCSIFSIDLGSNVSSTFYFQLVVT